MVEFVLDGDSVYIRPPGAPWTRIDAIGALKGQPLAMTANPLEQLRPLADAQGVREVGSEAVNGVATTKFRARLDPAKVVAASGAPPELLEIIGGPDQVLISCDVLLDRRGRTIRLRELDGTRAGTFDLTIDFSDYGKQVSIAVPPADQVARVLTASSYYEMSETIDLVLE
jgi:hypothetical protein